MVKPWLAGIAGLLMTSAVAVAQDAPISSSTTTTTTQTAPVYAAPAPVYTAPAPVYQVAPPTTTTVRVDRAASQENGLLTERTRTYETQAPTPQVVVPLQTQTTTVERTTTVQPQ
ncbi:MAG: hypothetical protein JWO51_58 [Rhodospirillales bacterium]|nr:hypothetical protein [Rhodospirillales bacterium]